MGMSLPDGAARDDVALSDERLLAVDYLAQGAWAGGTAAGLQRWDPLSLKYLSVKDPSGIVVGSPMWLPQMSDL